MLRYGATRMSFIKTETNHAAVFLFIETRFDRNALYLEFETAKLVTGILHS